MYAGFDIGGTKCASVLGRIGDRGGKAFSLDFLGRDAFPTRTERNPREIVEDLFASMDNLLAAVGARTQDVEGIGISCGGPLDSSRGVILSPPNLPGWDGIPIVRWTEERFQAPVFLQNDANACAVAEWKFGAGRGCRNMVFLTFGTGMGAGLILDGRLYSGTNDMAGEVGHIRLAEDGPVGYGKRGSFEGFCSGGGIAQLAREMAGKKPGNRKDGVYSEDKQSRIPISAKDVGEAASRGNRNAREILAESGKYLGKGLSILIDVLNPEVIVIGSIFARCGEFLIPAMAKAIREEALELSSGVCRIVPAALGDSIGDYASLSIAISGMGE